MRRGRGALVCGPSEMGQVVGTPCACRCHDGSGPEVEGVWADPQRLLPEELQEPELTATLSIAEPGEAAGDGGSTVVPRARAGEAVGPVVSEALSEAARLMKEARVLDAETVLAKALEALVERGAEATDEVAALRRSSVFRAVFNRVVQYDAGFEAVATPHMKLLWEAPGSRFELALPGGNCFIYRMSVDIDASLCECLALSNELDLVPKAQPMVGAPELLGPRGQYLLVTLSRMRVLMFSVELLLENLRVHNSSFGFLAESIRSSFPAEGRPIPERNWRSVRPCVKVTNLWVPCGGGRKGTVLVQVNRAEWGFHVPQVVLNFVFRQLASTFMHNLRVGAAAAADPSSPWATRIAEDSSGLYAELRKIEAAAALRPPVTAQTLPLEKLFDRSWRLRPEHASGHACAVAKEV